MWVLCLSLRTRRCHLLHLPLKRDVADPALAGKAGGDQCAVREAIPTRRARARRPPLFKGRWSKRHTRCHAPRAEVARAYARCGSPAHAGTSLVLAPPSPLWQATAVPASRAAAKAHAQKRCRSSVVEHSLGKGEVVSSILTGSTSCYVISEVRSPRAQLQRLDGDLAELDHALAELQRQWSFGVHAAADGRGFLAVERDGKVAALGRNLHRAPFATGLGHRVDLGVIDDGAGAVARIGPCVVDVALVAGLGSGLLGILAADEDAAVGIVAGPELDVDLEVLVFFLRDQERRGLGVLLVLGHDRAVVDREIGVAVAFPVIEILAVEERDPALAGLGLRRTGHGKRAESQNSDGECRPACHGKVLPWRLIDGNDSKRPCRV